MSAFSRLKDAEAVLSLAELGDVLAVPYERLRTQVHRLVKRGMLTPASKGAGIYYNDVALGTQPKPLAIALHMMLSKTPAVIVGPWAAPEFVSTNQSGQHTVYVAVPRGRQYRTLPTIPGDEERELPSVTFVRRPKPWFDLVRTQPTCSNEVPTLHPAYAIVDAWMYGGQDTFDADDLDLDDDDTETLDELREAVRALGNDREAQAHLDALEASFVVVGYS